MEIKNRRQFLKRLFGLTAGVLLPSAIFSRGSRDRIGEILPLRKLGRTDEYVTMLGLGGYHIGWTGERDAAETIEAAIEGGVRFFDTAYNYNEGRSEERYGKYLTPKYRDEIFLMTKSIARNGEDLRKEFETSLRRLKTDQTDLLQLHTLFTPTDVDSRIENKVVDVLVELLTTGKTRHIGFTSHMNPYAHLRMLDRLGSDHAFSTIQMPANLIDLNSEHSYIRKVFPPALEKGLGILAMKTLADGRFFSQKKENETKLWESSSPIIPNRITIEDALFFIWSLPVSVLITGAENADLIREKVQFARNFYNLNETEKEKILNAVMDVVDKEKIEYYKNIKPEHILKS